VYNNEGLIRVKKDKNNSQIASVDLKVMDVISFYTLSIKFFEEVTNKTDDKLSQREIDFLVCSLINFHQGRRYLLSNESFDVYSKIGNFKNIQEVRIYSLKDRIKRWLKKDGKSYKLPPFVENLTDSSNTRIELNISLEDASEQD
jgi:hypothetical protein